MASIEECEIAFRELGARLAGSDPNGARRLAVNRSVSCQLLDLGVTYVAQLREGGLHDITREDGARRQIRLALTSDDLVALTAGRLSFGAAWSSGRLRVQAGVMDLLTLRALL